MATTRKSGGAAPYRKGAAHENLVGRAYRDSGWPVVSRSPKSKDLFDLICIRHKPALVNSECGYYMSGRTEIHLVQCKMQRHYMGPAERESLKELAREIGAVPVLAYGGDIRKQQGPIHRVDLRTGGNLEDLQPEGADSTSEAAGAELDQQSGGSEDGGGGDLRTDSPT